MGLSFAAGDAAAGRGAVRGAAPAAGALDGLLMDGADAMRGAAVAGAAAGAEKLGAGAEPPAGPPGGSVGSLMVGAAEGFGGRLMRTVSFLG